MNFWICPMYIKCKIKAFKIELKKRIFIKKKEYHKSHRRGEKGGTRKKNIS